LLAAVDAADADRRLQRLRVGDGLDAAALAGDLQPDPLAPLRLAGEPLTPGLPAGERERRVGLLGHAGTVVANLIAGRRRIRGRAGVGGRPSERQGTAVGARLLLAAAGAGGRCLAVAAGRM